MKLYQKLVGIIGLFWACSSPSVEISQTEACFNHLNPSSTEYIEVYLRNKTDKPVMLSDIKSSQSFFIIQKQDNVILPKDSIQVLVTIDSRRINGLFDGKIDFYTSENQVLTIRIYGFVNTKMTVRERCRYDFGGVFFDKNTIDFGRVILRDTVRDTIWIYNPSDEALSFRMNCTQLLAISPIDEVQPHDSVQLTLAFSTADPQYLGRYSEACPLSIGDEGHGGILLVDAYVVEDFSQVDTDTAPRIKVLSPRYNFGRIDEGDDVSHSYTVKNEGSTNLIIHKVHTSCGCTTVSDKVRVIAPDDSTRIEVVFRSEGRHGSQKKTIILYNNDPQNPEVTLHLNGFVK